MRTLGADTALEIVTRRHALHHTGTTATQVANDLVGLHTTSPVSPYLSLHARTPSFDRHELDALMWTSWHLVRFRAMRLTMFVFPTELLEVAAAATRHIAQPLAQRWLRDSGLRNDEFERLADGVDTALADGPATVRQLRQLLDIPASVDLPGVVSRMCDRGQLVGGAPPRSWRSSIRRYHRWGDVLTDVDIARWDEPAALANLIDRYIHSYGPVTLDDIAWWTGVAKRRCRAALEDLGCGIEEVGVDDWPGPLYCAGDPLLTDSSHDGVAALPLLDPYVQGYRNRERFLDPTRHDFVYDGGGNSTATLIHHGRIIGVWQLGEPTSGSVMYHLFESCPASIRASAEVELAAAGSLYFDRSPDVSEVRSMPSLRAGGGRSAAHPLDGLVHRASRRTPTSEGRS